MFPFSSDNPVIGKSSVVIGKQVEDVFKFIGRDFYQNYPKWSPEVVELEPLSEGPIKVNSMARQVRVDQGHKTESTFKVTEYEPCQRLVFEGVSNPYRCSYELEDDRELSATRVTFTFELQEMEMFMKPFEKLIRVAVQDGTKRTLHNLKRLIESEVSAEMSS